MTGAAWDGTRLRLDRLGGAVAVCSSEGALLAATPAATSLLRRLGVAVDALPIPLPAPLWNELATTPLGEATQWRPAPADDACLGCTRYPLGDRWIVLLMREVSEKHVQISQRMHRQRLETTGRLVASIAHDLRTPLSSILFNAEALSARAAQLTKAELSAAYDDICVASQRLRKTIDGLLDFARLGPPVDVEIPIAETIERARGLVGAALREGKHRLITHVHGNVGRVRGNPLVVEQALVNLVVNAIEAGPAGDAMIHIRAERTPDAVHIIVADDGQGIAPDARARVFEPFFTTKPNGTGLGLTTAREAMRAIGGDLLLEPSARGARFVIVLPATRTSDKEERS
jgi:signal transduction histidine kinase